MVLADEPTANWDSSHGHDIGCLPRRLATLDGRSVVIVSHDERLREIADHVLWLEDGSFRELTAMAVDPICHMAVTADQDGTTPPQPRRENIVVSARPRVKTSTRPDSRRGPSPAETRCVFPLVHR